LNALAQNIQSLIDGKTGTNETLTYSAKQASEHIGLNILFRVTRNSLLITSISSSSIQKK
jgi:hypothetical protein